jgi:biopolymer transport protein ExbD
MRKKMFGSKRAKKEPMEIDITSLLDILVILLVFLLKSYNASDLKLDLVKNLKVPDSKARKLGNHAVIIQVDQNSNVWVGKRIIAKIPSQGSEIPELLELLKNKKEAEKAKIAQETRSPASKVSKAVNLVFDKDTPYKSLQKIMHTSAIAGFTEFKFIVQGNY